MDIKVVNFQYDSSLLDILHKRLFGSIYFYKANINSIHITKTKLSHKLSVHNTACVNIDVIDAYLPQAGWI